MPRLRCGAWRPTCLTRSSLGCAATCWAHPAFVPPPGTKWSPCWWSVGGRRCAATHPLPLGPCRRRRGGPFIAPCLPTASGWALLIPWQALELVFAEMACPSLSPSMRCGLLNATGALCHLPIVAAFWERCAALGDEEVRRPTGTSAAARERAFAVPAAIVAARRCLGRRQRLW
jgi:hypothetical protein